MKLTKIIEYNTITQKIDAQLSFCYANQTPLFAPNNGICWSCHRQIYDHITLEKASTTLITGCPCCSRSFCD